LIVDARETQGADVPLQGSGSLVVDDSDGVSEARLGITGHGDQVAVPGVLMRGGTSRGLFFHRDDLPSDSEARDRVILAAYGSPDSRQIDGVGGAHPLTSKVAIISRSARRDADVDYLFGQVRVDEPIVDYSGNCGNMLSAVGPFAVDEGLVHSVEPITSVRVHVVNTGQVVVAHVPVVNSTARTGGRTAIAGVPGTGASILLDFARTGGSLGHGVLPTGRAREAIDIAGHGAYEVSIVDAANPVVFVEARALGLTATELVGPAWSGETLELLESIRGIAAHRLGVVAEGQEARRVSPAIPKVYAVAPPAEFVDRSGREIARTEVDVVARGLSMGRLHDAYALTVAVCTAVSARIPGTVVAAATGAFPLAVVRIGHPGGITTVDVDVTMSPRGRPSIRRARVERTARRLMAGLAFVPAARLAGTR
jgi:2-methylaconitate cis-trans-isomerase PrpF